ncbi:hypothetical protein BDV34DRAFT_62485 [Aspergillus parasiticus]|uniref:F-box domain-containing protein n=1 Tax=Aspergillus parasiticus TaxID=5067 RepID=A0A5N6E3Q8_ASPPA|nr:hypothetical protein BDV34DRAFT_62485 [Aspergillus parasiticus]
MTLGALDCLPREIFDLVLGYLASRKHGPEPPDAYFRAHGDSQESDQPSWYSLKLQTLASLCLVCRHLCRAVQPILYQEFMLGYGDSWRSDLYTWHGRLSSFMRTVAYRRDLAALVKRIYIHPYLLEIFGEEKEVLVFDWKRHKKNWKFIRRHPRGYIGEDEARSTLQELTQALGIERLQQLSAGDLVTVLITELPNLEQCSIQLGPYNDEIVRSSALQAADISHLPLRTIDICLRATVTEAHCKGLFNLRWCAEPLLSVSTNLETLNLHMCNGISPKAPFPSLPNLKTLRLTYSRLGEWDLEGLLSSCTGLRNFFYEATSGLWPQDRYGPASYDCSDHFQLANAVKYLSRHTMLETIHMDLRWRGHSPYRPQPRAVFSFRHFPALKHLFLNLDEFHSQFWAGDPEQDSELLVQLLPQSIGSFHLAGHITDDLYRLEKSLLGLVHAVSRGQFPGLEEVRWDQNEELSSECECRVRKVFTEAGVSFHYDSWPTTSTTFGDGGGLPAPNYKNPFPLPREEDYEDL